MWWDLSPWCRIRTHATEGGVDASRVGVCPNAGSGRGAAAEAVVEAGQASGDAAAGDDPARLGDADEPAGDRAHAADGRVACAQGDPRLQRAWVRVVAPSFRGRATPPDFD